MSKVDLLRSVIGLKKLALPNQLQNQNQSRLGHTCFPALFLPTQPIRCQIQNQSRRGHPRFPALGVGYVYLCRVLIGSLLFTVDVIGHCNYLYGTQLKTALRLFAISTHCKADIRGFVLVVSQNSLSQYANKCKATIKEKY